MHITRDIANEKPIAECMRIKADHDTAIVRTVARGSVPSSVSRVFASGTKRASIELLPAVAIGEL